MARKNEIIVKDIAIKTMTKDGIDYICITDIARQKNVVDPNGVIANWMRNRNTIEFLGGENCIFNGERTLVRVISWLTFFLAKY